jgi:hypothetical protein
MNKQKCYHSKFLINFKSLTNYTKIKGVGGCYSVKRHFQQYFRYIVAVLLVEETGLHRENHSSAASHWQNLSQ